MSHTSKEEYLESCRRRYPSRNRAGKSAMIDEVSDTLGWDRKHAIKALNGRVAHGKHAKRRSSKPTYGPAEQAVIVAIWKHSEQPCGARLKQTLPHWIDSYQARHGVVDEAVRAKILNYRPRTLDRITAPLAVWVVAATGARPAAPVTGSRNSSRSAAQPLHPRDKTH
jgi:hypothetical protein